MERKQNKAFSVLDLIIVLAIFVVLALVAIPSVAFLIKKDKDNMDSDKIDKINEALYDYQKLNGRPTLDGEDDYVNVYAEVMSALGEYGYGDKENPYSVNVEFENPDKYLIWYLHSNTVGLIKEIQKSYFETEYAPNFYKVKPGNLETYGFILSTEKSGDKGDIAEYYLNRNLDLVDDATLKEVFSSYEVGVANGIDIPQVDTTWYTKEVIATKKADIKLNGLTPASRAQEAKQKLLGLSALVENGITFAGMQINLSCDGEIDLSYVNYTPIAVRNALSNIGFKGNLNLNDANGKNTVIKGLKIKNNQPLVSATYKTQIESGLYGGGQMVAYGLFGLLDGRDSAITVQGITFKDVSLNATKFSSGNNQKVTADSIGVVAGLAIGDVTIKDVIVGSENNPAYVNGFDGVGGLVGRFYGYLSGDETLNPYVTKVEMGKTLTIDNVEVYANLEANKSVGGFVGVTSNNVKAVKIANSSYFGVIKVDGKNNALTSSFGEIIGYAKDITGGVEVSNSSLGAQFILSNLPTVLMPTSNASTYQQVKANNGSLAIAFENAILCYKSNLDLSSALFDIPTYGVDSVKDYLVNDVNTTLLSTKSAILLGGANGSTGKITLSSVNFYLGTVHKVNDNELAIGLFAPKTTFDLENTYIVSKGVGELYNTLSAGQNYSLVAGAESILQVV